MKIIPAIDLKEGKCVRLYQGDFSCETIYSDNPIEIAKGYESQGAEDLHVVDLDGAFEGKSQQIEIIKKIANATRLRIQYGGGIRKEDEVKELLDCGIERIIIGSAAIHNKTQVLKWLEKFGRDKFVFAFDIKMEGDEPYLVTHGWQEINTKKLWQIVDEYQDVGIKHILCTDIERDGTLSSPNVKLYRECIRRYTNIHFQASGGVSSLEDLKALNVANVSSVIIGKALYEKKFTLDEALATVAEVFPC